MKVLVTGCAGFIGSNFVRWLLRTFDDVEITNLDDLTYAGNLANLNEVLDSPRHRFVKGNICDKQLVRSLVMDVDTLINFAAESHVDRSIDSSQKFLETNIQGTQVLLEAVRLQKRPLRFVQVSTDEVYGSLDQDGYFTENTPVAPNNPYAATKAAADLLARSYFKTHNLDVVISRCCNNYGPFQFPEKFIPLVIYNASQGLPIPVYGTGENIRDWIHVDDHSRGVWTIATQATSGSVYNLGAHSEWRNIDLVQEILDKLNKPLSLIKFVKDRPGHDRRYAIDFSKIKNELGWEPKIDFSTGLEQTIAWYMDNSEWLLNVVSGDYQSFYEKWYGERL